MHETPNSVRGNSSPSSPVQISAPHPCKQANSSLLAPAGTSQLRARQTCTALGTSCSLIARITKCLSRRENDSLTSERQRTPRAAMLISVTDGCQLWPEVQWLSHQSFLQPHGRGESQHRVYGATILPQSGLLGQHLSPVGRRCRGYGGPEHCHGLDGVFKS